MPVDRWSDCTQEVFSRLLQRLPAAAWNDVLGAEGDERREFLRAIDTVKKRVQRERRPGNIEHNPLADRKESRQRQLQEERDVVQSAAREVLSRRQQRLLQMLADGFSIHEIGDELGMSPERVSDEKYKAIQKLRSYFQQIDDSLV